MLKYEELIRKMTLEEKIKILSGKDYWRTKQFPHLGIPSITMCDGPHGLRHQEEFMDHLGVNESNESTCFPLACLTAASFDEELVFEMAKAIGLEALAENVQIVLGPGANIKRNPLCGRNFEYFSEDPFLAAKMATGWISGIQSMGISASLKHFAMNSQENYRMKSNSIIDEKTKYEIYLKAFLEPVKAARPGTVMCSYNLVDGIYASDNKVLLREILREKWGYEGVIVTDWGAMNDRIESLKAGLDLEMPGSEGYYDTDLALAIENGFLEELLLDESVDRILELVFSTMQKRDEKISEIGERGKVSVDIEKHHALARKIAGESAVLLKNEGEILPLNSERHQKIKVVGSLAKYPRYQGAGSSHINPYKVSSMLDAFDQQKIEYEYIEGYDLKEKSNPLDLIGEALRKIEADELVVLALGLPDEYESEGFDRNHMRLPESQNNLVEEIAKMTDNIIVVLFGGAPVEMPWIYKVKALLNLYLPGQAGGDAAFDLLFGVVNPSGKLPETYPIRYEDCISSSYYGVQRANAEYREGIYVGYRYYDKIAKAVRFPFGFGLSYTTFELFVLRMNKSIFSIGEEIKAELSVNIKNTGLVFGKEVVQLYIRPLLRTYMTEDKSLKAFSKVSLNPEEEKTINMVLDGEAFASYDVEKDEFIVYDGDYEILVGTSSRNIACSKTVSIRTGNIYTEHPELGFYNYPDHIPTREDFEAMIKKELPNEKSDLFNSKYTLNNTLEEMNHSFRMKVIVKIINYKLKKSTKISEEDKAYKGTQAMLMETPIRRLTLLSPDQLPKNIGEAIVHIANREYAHAIRKLIKNNKH
ncbi:MAG: glycoside hydrolase family 3 C-terminal domain-containing protein [Clostridiaceae bacterium]